MPGQVSGAGSLFRLFLHDRPLSDYRSAYPDRQEQARMALLSRYFLNHGIMMAPYGMGNLSTATTDDDIDCLAQVLQGGLRDIARSD